jgi:pyrophosphatase PpaX
LDVETQVRILAGLYFIYLLQSYIGEKTMKAILFDIDGVLLDSFEANLKFFQDIMQKLDRRKPTREEFSKLFHLSTIAVLRILLDGSSEEEIQKAFSMAKYREVAYPMALLKMPEHTEQVLDALSKRYDLGIVSSRLLGSIFESPQMIRLKHYFKVVVSYEDTAQHKPHPEPLLFATSKLAFNPKEIVYVGDAETDLIAAKAAGMKIVMYSKQHDQADACTSNFAEIPKLILKL